jgi:hypothetical protein
VAVYRWTAEDDLPLKKGMTVEEVEEALGTATICGGGGSMTHMTVVYDLDPNSQFVHRTAVVNFNPHTGRLTDWNAGDSRLPPWLASTMNAVGW